MDSVSAQIVGTISHYFTMKNITAISVITALYFGIKNLSLIRKADGNKQDEMLFSIVTANIDSSIQILEKLDQDQANDAPSWAVATMQLSSFHNMTNEIQNHKLRKCYCAKLHSYMLRIKKILDKVDDYRFFYGLKDYTNKSPDELLRNSYPNHTNISPNALGCVAQFLTLFHGTNLDYMENIEETNRILQPVYYGFKGDSEYSVEEIEKMPQPFKNIFQYITEWSSGVQKLLDEKKKQHGRP